jgi:hypothetical protein
MTKKQLADLFDESERLISERSANQIAFLSIIYTSFDTKVLIISKSIHDIEEGLYGDDNNKDPSSRLHRYKFILHGPIILRLTEILVVVNSVVDCLPWCYKRFDV